GPDQVQLETSVPLQGEDMRTRSEFEVVEGEEVSFVFTWSKSYQQIHSQPDANTVVENVTNAWTHWSKKHTPSGPYTEPVLRSLLTLKALTHHATAGIVAAATTSLPEAIGGVRNWDYRSCWLRDST